MYVNRVLLPQVEPLCVFGKGLWYDSQVSERTVDLFHTGAATGPWARRDSVDLRKRGRDVNAGKKDDIITTRQRQKIKECEEEWENDEQTWM